MTSLDRPIQNVTCVLTVAMESNNNILPELRSRSSIRKVLCRFVNVTERTVRLVWINFEGRPVTYKDLRPNQTLDVTTFKTHPWMAFDIDTSDKMHIDKSYIFMPKSWKDHVANIIFPNGDIPDDFEPRILIRITLPLYNLRAIALKTIRNRLTRPEDALKLELPRQLMEEIRKVLQYKINKVLPYSRQNPSPHRTPPPT